MPLYRANDRGYFEDEGIKVSIMEPHNVSDVTELIASGYAPLGFKAMIHTIAAQDPVQAIGTLLDEPITGIVSIKGRGITSDFQSLKGKRIGYVGQFGKIQLDELTSHYGMTPDDYTAVKVGMNVARYIIAGDIDAGVGLENVQQCELEEWCVANGRPRTDAFMLRIDELACLGCCCFCSILYIGNTQWLNKNPEKAKAFMRAVKRATDEIQADPVGTWTEFKKSKKVMDTPLQDRIFERSFVYLRKDLYCEKRDFDKVTGYSKRLGVIPVDFKQNYTNKYLTHDKDVDTVSPDEKQRIIAQHQKDLIEGKRHILPIDGLAPAVTAVKAA